MTAEPGKGKPPESARERDGRPRPEAPASLRRALARAGGLILIFVLLQGVPKKLHLYVMYGGGYRGRAKKLYLKNILNRHCGLDPQSHINP